MSAIAAILQGSASGDAASQGGVADLVVRAQALWDQAVVVWVDGGPAMVAIAINAFVMFALGLHVQLSLRARGFLSVSERTWRRWIEEPDRRKGPVGRILDAALESTSVQAATQYFGALRTTENAPFTRDLRMMRICISTAPLLGLFGTVTGMLATFGALATGAGGEKTMAQIAEGISEALITTETGLVVALPGLFFQYQLARKHERYKAFLAQLESAVVQHVFARTRAAAATVATAPALDDAASSTEPELAPAAH